MRTAWLIFFGFGFAGVVLGCSGQSSSSNTPPANAGTKGGTAGAAGSAGASGSAGSGTAGSSSGAAGAAGTAGAGGSSNGCRSSSDCPPSTLNETNYCLSPGRTPLPSLQGGCMTLNCTYSTPPTGNGSACMTDSDCVFEPTDGAPGGALLCSNNQCVQCASDADCALNGQGTRCAMMTGQFNIPFPECVGCLQNSDCKSGDAPFCFENACVSCASDADCTVGVCAANFKCAPGCSISAPCTDPLLECDASSQRCAPRACMDSSQCPANSLCAGATCGRRVCNSDADCDGVCVNQECFDTLGSCQTRFINQ